MTDPTIAVILLLFVITIVLVFALASSEPVADTSVSRMSREAVLAELAEMEAGDTPWHSYPRYDELVERLVQIDGSPFNGHHYYGNCIMKGEDWRSQVGLRGALNAGGLGAATSYAEIMGDIKEQSDG